MARVPPLSGHVYMPASDDDSDRGSNVSSEDENADGNDDEESMQHGAGGFLHFEEVVTEERDCIDRNNLQRHPDGRRTAPFSLAFSGGGIRAAAFQAGVLWRLAREDRLKDVEYFTAVSGGAYITSAFASFICGMEKPKEGEVREWYADVVARTVCRMQRNAGDFVRDCGKNPGVAGDGSGVLPRWMDLPILLVTIVWTLSVSPFFLIIALVVPATVLVEFFFGEAMREAFCTLDTGDNWLKIHTTVTTIMRERSPCAGYAQLVLVTVGMTLALFIIRRFVPACNLKVAQAKARERWDGSGAPPRPEATMGYCLEHAASALLRRASIFLLFMLFLLYAVTFLEIFTYNQSRKEFCNRYVNAMREDGTTGGCSCKAYSEPWWNSTNVEERFPEARVTPLDMGNFSLPESITVWKKPLMEKNEVLKKAFQYVVGPAILIGICALPYFGNVFLTKVFAFVGPLLAGIVLLNVLQFRVYGPITDNAAGIMKWDVSRWHFIVRSSLALTLILAPFFEELRCALHQYYKRCLQLNFFYEGKDRKFKEVADNPYCPFVILTGTSSDFQPPGDSDTISELSFSALHCGSEETGYLPSPHYRTLAKCTALSGAGCLDAISLTMNETLSMRFWLEMLNLSWGDYVMFRPWQTQFTNKGWINRFIYRLPAALLSFIVYLLIYTGWESCIRENCEECELQYKVAISIWTLMVGLSFFSFLPFVDRLLLSPLLRQLHQATQYFYVGRHPPPMLYVTDGGVKDCTSLVQLLWRRCERILLVLAAADPHDELSVLKAGMEVAKSLKIATFYDPEDPRRDLSVIFERYKDDRNIPFLHIGISYCWDPHGKKPTSGHIFIVKNRLPPDFEGMGIQPLLTEEEMRGEPDADDDEFDPDEWEGLTTDALGPFCCCDCCHTRGINCGPKFPHGTFTGYLYLTPQWCNSLARLAYEVSGAAIYEVSRAGTLASKWEDHLPVE